MKELKEVLYEFSSIFTDFLCIITVMLSGFLIFINLYHYNEIKYEYYTDYANSDRFKEYKEKITSMKEKIKNTSTKSLDNKLVLSTAQLDLISCLEEIEKGGYYNLNKEHIKYKDIYDYNNELIGKLQYNCLFKTNYFIKKGIEDYNSNLKYDYYDRIENDKNMLLSYGEDMKNHLLNNSSYYFTTVNSKVSIYNDLLNYFNLTTTNYDILLNDVTLIANWYLDNAGGN